VRKQRARRRRGAGQQRHALDHGGGSPDDNDFDDYVGYLVAKPLAGSITTAAIPALPLPAALWPLVPVLLGVVGLGRR
jgi:hypothetical protein